jgi:hypothetical protein
MEAKKKNPRRQVPHRTNAKRNTLRLLAEYFCLKTKHAAGLLFNTEDPTESQRFSTGRTLRLLFRDGLAYRISYYDLANDRSGKEFVYGLTDKGIRFVEEHDIYDPDFAKTFDEHSARTLDHELEITAFHIALKKFCIKHSLELHWQQCDLKKKTIAPDAYFAITDPAKPAGKNTLHYFLEMERSKIGNMKNGEPSIIRKLGKFYDYYNTAVCEKEWYSFRHFRVIVVLRNPTRMANLLKALEKQYKHRMFWLTTEPMYKIDTTSIGDEIFQTPKDYAQRSYSFHSV